MQYQKVKSASKVVLSRSNNLSSVIRNTLNRCAEVVGSTLGPGGLSVVIERQEERLPPLVTKDGVTVFRNLGFSDPTAQLLMETARDAAVRTADKAGDGTTTATILAASIVDEMFSFSARNPKISPQKIMRSLEKTFRDHIEPTIKGYSRSVSLATEEGRKALHAVAKVSANGDVDLADAVLTCFELTGDEGNVTLIEAPGPSGYQVNRIEGYPVPVGYEDSCGKFFQSYINDLGRQMCVMDRPSYVLYHGRLNDIYAMMSMFETIGQAAEQGLLSSNVVIIAAGFSEQVQAHLAVNFQDPRTPNYYLLTAPMNAMRNSQYDFLVDIAALTGAKVLDPMNNPVENFKLEDLGYSDGFESSRFRSVVVGHRDPEAIMTRVDQLKKLLTTGLSEYDAGLIKERIGKITGGIARLQIFGSSSGELREKRDRAEDAVMAVRGALSAGVLPAGGWTLLKLVCEPWLVADPIAEGVLSPALLAPVKQLFLNAGFHEDEIEERVGPILQSATPLVFDLLEGRYVDPYVDGLLDSVPAVLEAIRSSLSIAGVLGTSGGTIAFGRDETLERAEAQATNDFIRNMSVSEADERP